MVPGPLTGAPVLESSLSVPLSRLAVCLLAPMMQRRRDGPPSPPGGRVLRRPSYSVSLHCEIWAKNKVLMRCAAEGWLRFGLRSCSYQPPRKAPVASSDAPPPSVSSPLTSSCRFQAEKCQEPKRVPFSVSSGTRTAETVTADPLISVVGGGGVFLPGLLSIMPCFRAAFPVSSTEGQREQQHLDVKQVRVRVQFDSAQTLRFFFTINHQDPLLNSAP